MQTIPFSYFCYVCGNKIKIEPEVPEAPQMSTHEVKCEKCGDKTHILVTSCPSCKKGVRYFLSDLDFPTEITGLSSVYVKLIEGIKSSLSDYVSEFKIPLPKRWTVGLSCDCGEGYIAEIPLPQLSD
ncbi:MAG: hypothetical protein ACTSU3_04150 [Candidatus Thorarchaeota archaeon]